MIEIVAGLLQLSLRVNNAVGKASVLSHVISFAQPAVIKMGWSMLATVCVVLTASQTDTAANTAPRQLTTSTENKDAKS